MLKTLKTKNKIMLSKLKTWPEWEECSKMKWQWKRTNNLRKCKNIIKTWLDRRKLESQYGETTKKNKTNSKFQEQIWLTLWLKTSKLQLPNLLHIDMFLIISKGSDQDKSKELMKKEQNKLNITRQQLKIKILKNINGLSKTLQITNTS
jgi:hypothetical protein